MQPKRPAAPDDPHVLAIIREAADRHAVPRRVALAFSWCESRLNPRAEGDLKWHEKAGGQLYRTQVLANTRFAFNPARLIPELWHSYGLFQLLACWHVQADEDPRALLDPAINADRGCTAIARNLRVAKGDPQSARLAYVGCGYQGQLCTMEVRAQVARALTEALARFQHEAT